MGHLSTYVDMPNLKFCRVTKNADNFVWIKYFWWNDDVSPYSKNHRQLMPHSIKMSKNNFIRAPVYIRRHPALCMLPLLFFQAKEQKYKSTVFIKISRVILRRASLDHLFLCAFSNFIADKYLLNLLCTLKFEPKIILWKSFEF